MLMLMLMLMLFPGTGRTAHALFWKKKKKRWGERQQSDAASEVMVAPPEVGAGERGRWQSEISQREKEKSVGISRQKSMEETTTQGNRPAFSNAPTLHTRS